MRITVPTVRHRMLLLTTGLLLGVVGCASRTLEAPSDQVRTAQIATADGTRDYSLYLPRDFDPQQPHPLLVALHGGWGTGAALARQSGLNRLADRYGYVIAYPDGLKLSWNAGHCCGWAADHGVDDVGFIRAMIARIRSEYVIAPGQTYGTGFSNGAMLLHRIACDAPGTFDAIAPVSGGPMIDRCIDRSGVTALLIQGRDDPRIPWNGGMFDGSYRPAMAEVVTMLRQRNGCAQEPQIPAADAPATCSTAPACRRALEWCGVAGVGHQWPGGQTLLPALLGANSDAFDATAAIGAFLERQRAGRNAAQR